MERPEPRQTRDDYLEQEDWLRYCVESGIDPFECETGDDPEPVILGSGPWAERCGATFGQTPDLREQMRNRAPSSQYLGLDAFRAAYQAVAFANCRGRVLNALITITWGTIGLTVDETIEMRLAQFLAAIDRWCAGYGIRPAWVWVIERGTQRGLHTHIIASLPAMLQLDFRGWFWRALSHICGCDLLHTPASKTLDIRFGMDENVGLQWEGFKYLFKGLSPRYRRTIRSTGVSTPLRPILGLDLSAQGWVLTERSGISPEFSPEAYQHWAAGLPFPPEIPRLEDIGSPNDLYTDRYLRWYLHELAAGRRHG